MYSQQQQGGRPGTGAPKMTNRYMKGRLPEGVDFAAYPGRSSTPLPTAESKSAERINQLKIWNEAATNDEKRRLNTAKGIGSGVANATATRRTDSFKDAKNRHSASFHGTTPPQQEHPNPDHVVADAVAHPPSYNRSAVGRVGGPVSKENEMYADRSDSETDDETEDTTAANTYPTDSVATQAADRIATQSLKPISTALPPTSRPVKPPVPLGQAPASQQTRNTPTNLDKSRPDGSSLRPEPKEAKGCCTIM